MQISDISIRRPVTTLTVTAAFLIFGWIAFKSMGVDLFPEVELPFVTVTTVLVGASPEVMDQNVTDVLEEQIKTINGIKTLQSQSYEGYSVIAVEFELEKDVDTAAEEVRAKVNLAKRNLPKDTEDPIVDKFDIAAMPIIWITVSGTADYKKLTYYADKVLKEQIQSVDGVGNVQTAGLREREIRVWLDPDKLQSRGITAQDVIGAIRLKHVELPGGRIETGSTELSIKVEGEFTSPAALNNLEITKKDGAPIYLKDVGRVDDSLEDYRTIARFNGKTCIGLGVRKQSGANTVEVADEVLKRLEEMRKSAPAGVSIDVAFDSSEFIKESMRGVQFDIIFGVILTAVVMYFFLRNVRTTIISMVSIPVSLVGGFVAMNALHFTVNNMTMLAMSLAVGMVIDDTIVVLENIFRHIENGEEPMKAASVGTDEVGLAVLAATSSIAAVFIPVAFMKGIIGRFFFQFGLTVALTIIISAFVSLTLTPFLSSRIIRHRKSHQRIYVIIENFFIWLEKTYSNTIAWAIGHRAAIVGIALLAFAGGILLNRFIGSEFISKADESRFTVRFELPTGSSIQKTAIRLGEMEKILLQVPEVNHIFSTVGTGSSTEVNQGNIMVILVPKGERKKSQEEIMGELRSKYEKFSDTIISVEPLEAISGGPRNVDVEFIIQGPNAYDLANVADKTLQDLKRQGTFLYLDTNLRLTKPEIKVSINRAIADDLGVDVMSISNEVYSLFGGFDAGKFKEGGYRYNIRVMAFPQFRVTPKDIEGIAVRSMTGQIIKGQNLVNYEVGKGPNVINRFNRMRSVSVYANVKGIPLSEGLERIEKTAAKYIPKTGNWGSALSGRSSVFRESFVYMFRALLIAVLVIYMVLSIQFESFVHAFTILLSLPLTLIGVFGALLLSGMTLNIFSMIGVIMLMGIVTKNAILLVDFANQERRRGVNKVDAVQNSGKVRLRPILMTASAVIIGVVPVAMGLSEGGETRAPMAISVIGGMIANTFLTLLVIPVVYLLLDDATEWVKARAIAGWQGVTGRLDKNQGEE